MASLALPTNVCPTAATPPNCWLDGYTSGVAGTTDRRHDGIRIPLKWSALKPEQAFGGSWVVPSAR